MAETIRAERPKRIAREVLLKIGEGQAPNMRKIMLAAGYSEKSASHGAVQNTDAYKKELEALNQETASIFARERARAIAAMPAKIKKARYRDLVDATDKFTKNHALLTGQATENVAIKESIIMLPGADDENMAQQSHDVV